MHRRTLIAALVLPPMLVAAPVLIVGCQQKTETAAPAASAPAVAAAPAGASGSTHTVAFSLDGSAPVGALQIDIAYTGEGRFVGDADAVACETKVDGALSSYNHIVDQKMLRAAFVAVKGFSGPTTFSECKFQGNAKAGDFTVTVKDSSSPDLAEISPPPSVKVAVN